MLQSHNQILFNGKFVSDFDGHYDIDGVSTSSNNVVVAGDEHRIIENFLGTLREIEERADMASRSLQNKKSTEQEIYSADYHSEYDDYLKQEMGGD